MAKTTSKKKATRKTKPAWDIVDPKLVFYVTKDRRIMLGGEEITEVDLKNLQAEVGALKQYKLWSIFDNTLRNKAIETGFLLSTNWEATQSGKMMLHNLGIMKSIMDSIQHVGPLHTPPISPKAAKVIPKGIASL